MSRPGRAKANPSLVTLLIGALVAPRPALSPSPPTTLRLVNAVYRHGDRSPIENFPKNTHTQSEWPQGFGWLSLIGMKQHYCQGQFFRQRYNGFLNETYIHNEITINSSDQNRCLMSAYCHLAGLYPPSGGQRFNKNISWQPIPVHTRPESEDNVLRIEVPCPKYDQLYQGILNSPAVKKEEAKNKVFYEFIENMTGCQHMNINTVWSIADTLFCEKVHNFSLPSWLNDSIFEKLLKLQDYSFILKYNTPAVSRFKGGPLLKQMIENMNNRINGLSDPQMKFYMYSAHDTTLAALLSVLQVYDDTLPPYASSVILELHEKSHGEYFVKVFYKKTTIDYNNCTEAPKELTLPGCKLECPFKKFLKLTKPRVPVNWYKECQLDPPPKVILDKGVITILSLVGIILVVVAALFITRMVLKRYRAKQYTTLITGCGEDQP